MENQIIIFIQKETFKLFKINYSKKYIKSKFLPIINYIIQSHKKKFLFSGSQGVGKTSMVQILKKVLEKFYNLRILSLNLDNYYLSKKNRERLSVKVHKLLITRGVPGTHNIKKLINDIGRFNYLEYPIYVPNFDKLIDDKSNKYKKIINKCDILFLEGWCCGSKPIEKKYLFKNINFIEKNFDKYKIWRKYYNGKLQNEYKKLFSLFDSLIFLKSPSFKYVLNWRLNQEKKNKSKNTRSRKMNKKEVKIFIQNYEKITKWMMKTLPKKADLVIYINKKQMINSIKIKY